MKAVIYARVSTQDQALGFSLATQKELCEKKARALGALEVEVVEDAYTGTELTRPSLDYVRQLVAAGKVDLVVVYDPDRLSRNLTDLLILCREFDKAGVKLEFVNFEWQKTPQGMLFLQMRGAFAEFEHALIKERTQRGKAKKAASGKIRCYAKPFGYDWDAEGDTLVINPQEAEIVKQMFEWLTDPLEPLTPWQITQKLGQVYPQGPRGKGWVHSSVVRMLKNPVYTGRLRRKDEQPDWKPVLVPAIIDQETFMRAQEMLARSKRFNPKTTRRRFLLQRLLVCGECGRRLTVVTHNNPQKAKYSYYTCPGRYPTKFDGRGRVGRCGLPPWRTEEIDTTVWDTIASIIKNPELFYQYITSEKLETASIPRRRLEEARKRLEQVQRVIERIDRAYFILEALPEEDYKRYRAEQEGELVRIEEDIKRLEAVINAQEQVQKGVEFLRQYAEKLARSVDELNFFQKQNITRELVQRVKIYADGSLEIEGYFNLPFTGPGKNVPDHCEELTLLTPQKNLKEPLSSSVLTCTHRKKGHPKVAEGIIHLTILAV
ncbi:recombinase family protein [Neomoorella thermoacetica]|uniref:recombinase family protein n=1 Tax=Neomoorella thermoacetica TaxID=1525 RepID=UPI0008FB0D5E|nr:recombinase family protein [Moorella thermoacetica]OIQ60230.1 transposon gamma-delta resolvase [Moorella thermoacetica]